ncbi:MAG TPA: hypothetical protein VJV03_11950 [Pyrinomonadaceae bacterium]|nr:hypothetical protein [Pyrinomonadaceae bacterium]
MFATAGKNALFLLLVIVMLVAVPVMAQKKSNETAPAGVPVLWRDPGDVTKRDLRYGPGSAELAPVGPFTFGGEESTGASPKFKVTDARGDTWVVKLGVEAQAETVATRIIWSVGYFADEAYYLDRVEIKNLPKLSRGQEFVEGKSIIRGARFEPKRKGIERGINWDWEENPFVQTRELDGLKVLMVLLGNYDTRLANNKILTATNGTTVEARYVATDVGATLGKVGGLGGKRSKNSLADFQSSKFITGVENGFVKFDYSTKPKGMGAFASLFKPSYRSSQAKKERAMKTITVANARWMGSVLAQLSDDQLRDAFRAASYDAATMEGFIKVIRARIAELNNLQNASVTASAVK